MIREKEIEQEIQKYGCISELDFQKTVFKLKINDYFENTSINIHSLLNVIENHTGFRKVVKLHVSKNNFNIIIKK